MTNRTRQRLTAGKELLLAAAGMLVVSAPIAVARRFMGGSRRGQDGIRQRVRKAECNKSVRTP